MSRGPVLVAWLFFAFVSSGCARQHPGDPIPGLNAEQLDRFRRGRAVFDSVFTPEAGLGPLFNASSCGGCHEDPVSGGKGDEIEVHATAFHADGVCDPLAGEGGPVIQQNATPALKAALGIDKEPLPKSATGKGLRTSLAIFGRGLLDAVPDSVLASYADPDDRNHDGISGRVNRFVDGRIGRFGRKAFVPHLDEFNAGAFVIEQGITNPVVPTEESIGGAPIPEGVDPKPEPEIDQEALDRTNDFVRFLAIPSPLKTVKGAGEGRHLFASIGCSSCHLPTLRTGRNAIRALDRRSFSAYTDLLLHDMGPDLADICLGLASPSEFRTEPLVGLRFATHFLHDGRASTLNEAIQLHGGEASGVRDRFKTLSAREQAAVIAFLQSL